VKPSFEVSYHDTDIAILSLLGEHDLATRDELRAALDRLVRSGEQLIVDLTQAEFIDSSVLNSLVQAQAQARERGLQLVLELATAPEVKRILEVTGLLERFPSASSREEAIRLARNGQPPAGG
jgi:anti-sigma B factor antagonist